MVTGELQVDIEEVAQNGGLWEELNFESRIEAVDYLDFHVIERIDGLLQTSEPPAALLPLKQRAEALKCQLEAINTTVFERIRAAIRLGHYRGTTLLNLITSYVEGGSDGGQTQPVLGYDALDAFTNGLLSVQAVPLETREREPEMVYYQKTPARIIFELVAKARFTDEDVFYDIGSGLGHVPILVNLLSGAAAKGIDVEPAYCLYANACAVDLNLSRVTFKQADARTADFSHGTVFFLYTPFEGRMLQEVLDRLRAITQHRQIRLFSYGPCTLHVARQDWLTCADEKTSRRYSLGEFKSCPVC